MAKSLPQIEPHAALADLLRRVPPGDSRRIFEVNLPDLRPSDLAETILHGPASIEAYVLATSADAAVAQVIAWQSNGDGRLVRQVPHRDMIDAVAEITGTLPANAADDPLEHDGGPDADDVGPFFGEKNEDVTPC